MAELKFRHPEKGLIIRDSGDTATFGTDNYELAVFTNDLLCNDFINTRELGDVLVKSHTWQELVEIYGEKYKFCVIDPKPEGGFVTSVPLK